MFDNNISWWQILWIICTVLSYINALKEARTHAITLGADSEDVTKAMISQAIYPLGAVMIILFFLALLLGGRKKKRKR